MTHYTSAVRPVNALCACFAFHVVCLESLQTCDTERHMEPAAWFLYDHQWRHEQLWRRGFVMSCLYTCLRSFLIEMTFMISSVKLPNAYMKSTCNRCSTETFLENWMLKEWFCCEKWNEWRFWTAVLMALARSGWTDWVRKSPPFLRSVRFHELSFLCLNRILHLFGT